jgi:hypothetical protein
MPLPPRQLESTSEMLPYLTYTTLGQMEGTSDKSISINNTMQHASAGRSLADCGISTVQVEHAVSFTPFT